MRKKKLITDLRTNYGKIPDVDYFDGDMNEIKAYYTYRVSKGFVPLYHVDDISWNDLSMDEVFQRLNASKSTAGEQVLYYTQPKER